MKFTLPKQAIIAAIAAQVSSFIEIKPGVQVDVEIVGDEAIVTLNQGKKDTQVSPPKQAEKPSVEPKGEVAVVTTPWEETPSVAISEETVATDLVPETPATNVVEDVPAPTARRALFANLGKKSVAA